MPDGVGGRARDVAGLVGEGAGLLAAVPLWWWWAADHFGYPPALWLPGVVWLAALIALLAWTGPPAVRPTGARRVALGAMTALALWSMLSTAWADDRGAAWAGGLRWALVALGVAGPLLWPPSSRALRAGVAAYVGVGAIAVVAGLLAARDGGIALDDGRLAAPADYPNATATAVLATAAAAFAGCGAARRWWVAGVLGGAASGLAVALVLTQSRGAVVAAMAAALVLALLAPGRARITVVLLATAGVAALGWTALTDVRRTVLGDGTVGAALDEATLVVLAAAVLGAATAALLTAWRGPAAAPRRPPPRLLAVLGTATALVLGAGLATGTVQDRWRSFKTPDYATLEAADSRFTGDLGSNRYDYWRVAVTVTRDHPVLGVGSENFAAPYLRERRSGMTPRYAHDLWLEVASTLGLPGLAFLLTAVGALAVAALRSFGRWTAAALVPGVVVLVHGSADWTPAFPVVALPAAGLAAAAAAARRPGAASAPLAARRTRLTATAVLAITVAAALPLWVSVRLIDRGVAATSTASAAADLEQAGRWDPIGPRPPLNRGIKLLLAGDATGATAALRQAADRDRSAWFAPFAVGLLDARAGRRDAALTRLDDAVAKNPRDARLRRTRDAVRQGRPPDPAATVREVLRPNG